MNSEEEMIKQVEEMRRQSKALRQQMSEEERRSSEQDHIRMLAKMDEMINQARSRIESRNRLRKQAAEYNKAHGNDGSSA